MAERSWEAKHPGPAIFSPCGKYRYRLERILGSGPTAAFIMVNPSTATETVDDQTVLMVQTVCKSFGIGRAIIGNIFAYRSKEISNLRTAADPIGPDNDKWLAEIATAAEMIIVAWGPPDKLPRCLRQRWRDVANILEASDKPIHCLTHLAGNHPRHPQVLKYDTPLPLWNRPQ